MYREMADGSVLGLEFGDDALETFRAGNFH